MTARQVPASMGTFAYSTPLTPRPAARNGDGGGGNFELTPGDRRTCVRGPPRPNSPLGAPALRAAPRLVTPPPVLLAARPSQGGRGGA